jgi:tRNA A37 threonylcarbamoyladenosine synthetase subunit TsaC/SUA5/YrdC
LQLSAFQPDLAVSTPPLPLQNLFDASKQPLVTLSAALTLFPSLQTAQHTRHSPPGLNVV